MTRLFLYMVSGLIFISSSFAVAKSEPPEKETGYSADEAVRDLARLRGYLQNYPELNVSAPLQNLTNIINDYKKNQEACKSRENKANTFCIESRNPDAKKYLVMSQVLMAGVSGMADACSKFGKVMDAGNKMLTAYQAACGSWRGFCTSSCSNAKKNVEGAKKSSEYLADTVREQALKIAAAKAAANQHAEARRYQEIANTFPGKVREYHASRLDRELETDSNHMSVAQKLETCNGYATQLAASAVGLLSMAKSFGEANNCENATSEANVASATPVDCTIPANKQNNMTCICQDAPRTPGCTTGLDSSVAAKSADSLRTASTSDYVPGTTDSSKIDLGGDSPMANLPSRAGDGGGGSLPGAPSGGPAGLGGGGGGGSGGPGSQAAQKSSINPNILGGEGGGGGGGGSWSVGGGEEEGLRQYLPGGARDPATLAGASIVPKEVTSQGGKSNWEKVRERYRDNKPSLLGN